MLGLAFAVLNVSPFKSIDSITAFRNPSAHQNYFLYLVMDCSFCELVD